MGLLKDIPVQDWPQLVGRRIKVHGANGWPWTANLVVNKVELSRLWSRYQTGVQEIAQLHISPENEPATSRRITLGGDWSQEKLLQRVEVLPEENY